ncbi:AcrR family transcriptional regulator [Silvibacterium bohemicum]|uniref:AcrR family transcriptional regulator n=1 Tax=Silvibacterium bohemicum TaxID=1577686 RepID=A0A841K896_9BACT|nr:TetR/AcrR family transcriptional regulator [Silvibacterium bohemicum]MBB6147341.1 AcrR family transcriptional regulator [Silvibacterium bohemicum]
MKKRLTRQESKALTQEKLLVAAAKAFARRGFAGASIDEITQAAGFSRGAFHSNFKNKDALFLALIEREIMTLTHGAHESITASSSAKESLENLRKFYAPFGSTEKDAFLLITEAYLYAVRNVRFGKKLSTLFRKVHDELKLSLERFHEQTRYKNPIPADQLILIGFSLGHGLALYNLMDGERYPEKMVESSQELVFDRLMGSTGK